MSGETSKIESFTTIVNGQKPLIILAKLCILDVCAGPRYTSSTSFFSINVVKRVIPGNNNLFWKIIVLKAAQSLQGNIIDRAFLKEIS